MIERIASLIKKSWGQLGVALAILVLGHWCIAAVLAVRTSLAPPDPRSLSPVYDNFPERLEYWREDAAVGPPSFEPYFHWRRGKFAGKFINLGPDGVRVTIKNPKPGAIKVFMFGGSTLWGSGAPDSQTIPSYLQSLLGRDYDVYNLGERGFVSTQELNYLLYLLAIGGKPDIVVFYDGVNDGYAGAYSPAVPRDPQVLRSRFQEEEQKNARPPWVRWTVGLYEASNYPRLVSYLGRVASGKSSTDRWDETVAAKYPENSAAVMRMYEANITQVRAIAHAYGFTALFFWQPNLFSLTRSVNEFEAAVIDGASQTLVRSQQAVYEEAKSRFIGREQEGIYFLGNIFDDVAEPIYADWNHIGPNGNRIIAAEMARVVLSKVARDHDVDRSESQAFGVRTD